MAATPKDCSERKKYLSRALTRHCASRFHRPVCGPRPRHVGPVFPASPRRENFWIVRSSNYFLDKADRPTARSTQICADQAQGESNNGTA